MWFSSFIVDFGGSFVFVVVMGTLLCWAVVAISIYAPAPHPPPFFPYGWPLGYILILMLGIFLFLRL